MKFNSIKDIENRVPKKGSFKHMLRRMDEQGRIVKDVNTTADVGTDEIPKQAKKFGNTVDKDGRPPTLSKKVKGSSTNVLYNLGLTESVAIKFERGEDYDTLHIKEKGKNRVEVRGKKGYESGNYDSKDKLHQVLDKLGKAANISELMNGETVVLNPKHPDGPRAIDTVQKEVDKPAEDSVILDMLEALGEIDKKSEIYVDMDGVLADFFSRWEEITGKHWRDIQGDDVQPALQAIRDDDDFWLDLKMTANAKNLLSLIKQVKGEYKILSAPLAGDKKAIPHKKEWVKNNLGFFPPTEVIIDADKAKYAKQPDGTPNILIDDFGSNINKWEAAGGIGFKHKDHKFERTAKNIKQAMEKEPVEEGSLLKNPKNTFLTKADTAYDFVKLGVNMANLKSMPAGSDVDEPDIMVAPYAGEKEMKYLMKQLKRIGYDVQDAQGYKDAHFDEGEVVLDKSALRNYITDLIIDYVQKEDDIEKLSYMLKNIVGKTVKHRGKRYSISAEDIVLASDSIKEITILSVKRADDAVSENFDNVSDIDLKNALDTMANNAVNGERLKDVFIMRYQHNMTFKEIGNEIGTGLDRARQIYQRALRKLRFILKDYVNENFADGKKKGKSRPGRVKRAGASCNGSVTSLRKRAKNASGEKAKMYHWCANMKSGRKKNK